MENSREFVGGLISRGQPLESSFLCIESPRHLLHHAKDGNLHINYGNERLKEWVEQADNDPIFLAVSWTILYTYYMTGTSPSSSLDGPSNADDLYQIACLEYGEDLVQWIGVHCFG